MGRVRIGTSGWNYPHWRGSFYPDELRRSQELSYAATQFDSVEINRSFYGLVKASTWRRWHDEAPEGFVYAIKGSGFITHNRRLEDVETPLANFFASGLLELGAKMGPILWQVPASMQFDPTRLDRFFAMLPKDIDSAARLARSHDSRVRDPAFGPAGSRRIRHSFEFRNESFLSQDMASLARAHGVAITFSHSSRWPYVEQVTAGFVYLRLHGPGRLYASRYGEGLDWWARRIITWAEGGTPADAAEFSSLRPPRRKGRDVYVYFDNDYRGYAPAEARALRRSIRGSV